MDAVQVITLTPNPAIDHTVTVDRLDPGAVHRARAEQFEAGGKGIGVAAVLAALGVRVAAGGWLGAENPERFERSFAQAGILDAMCRVPGRTRTNIKLADATHGETTDINLPGIAFDPVLQAGAEAGLLHKLVPLVGPGTWVTLAGSLPPGLTPADMARMAATLRGHGARLMVDTGGAALRALLAALQPAPDFIKPNRAELEELVGRALPTPAAVADAAAQLQQDGIALVVVSLGGEGAVIASQGQRWFAATPRVPVATTVGAGDALVAGTLGALIAGRAPLDAAVFGMACAAARIQRIAPGLPPRAEIDALAAQIQPRSI
ncbi:1-phosphofructokinase family hexose kinase [Pseudorhodoferax sp. Leaf274]|uniref:1-phosphofructokinase family hexose kinase n=1 Tax=Pseudorhodoferax sp. Leaf274 TaxID=1736318 RepID=UPI000703691C|nr:hexose kinase [Pseudorhodoferax sp. Leaf274]KQP49975.1 1-phosphofructokinase [Pseudorhodoferax sp. Leaf274]